MKHFNTISYPDLFEDNIENLSVSELTDKLKIYLQNIPSKPFIYHIAKINFELFKNPYQFNVQFELLNFWLKGIDSKIKEHLFKKINVIIKPKPSNCLLFGKRYILDFYNFLFENYNNLEERRLTPDEILNTFKAYLIIVYISNQKDYKTFENKENNDIIENLQKINWSHVINQYECNNNPNHIAELIKFYATVNEIFNDEKLNCYLKEYMKNNGFKSHLELLCYGYMLFHEPERIYQTVDFYKRIPITIVENEKLSLKNISLNPEYFNKESKNNVYYKSLKERPLFEVSENQYIILDVAFLKGKIYTGFIFDFYYKTSFNADKPNKFHDFKSEFLSKKVIEEIVFKRIMENLFIQNKNVVYFDKKEKISVPDCFCRVENKVYFFECKDYLLNSKIYQTYSYEVIKEAIDKKFITDKSGINQIREQIYNYINLPNDFPCDKGFSRTSQNLVLYPIIVHTNFTLSLPGIQQYLNQHL